MKRIVFKNLDGSCGVIIPAGNWQGTMAELAAKDVPNGLEWRIVDVTDLPSDRTFRAAWTDDNLTSTVDVDMDKARNIHMHNIRLARNAKLKDLDVEQLKGIDVSSTKQALRDLPQTFDLSGATTPDELQALWPTIIK